MFAFAGFKTFERPNFFGPLDASFTAIVGPNGCDGFTVYRMRDDTGLKQLVHANCNVIQSPSHACKRCCKSHRWCSAASVLAKYCYELVRVMCRLGKTVIADAVRFTLGDAVSSIRLQTATEAINDNLKRQRGAESACVTQVCFQFRSKGGQQHYVCVRKRVAGSGRCTYYAANLQQAPSAASWLDQSLPALALVRECHSKFACRWSAILCRRLHSLSALHAGPQHPSWRQDRKRTVV